MIVNLSRLRLFRLRFKCLLLENSFKSCLNENKGRFINFASRKVGYLLPCLSLLGFINLSGAEPLKTSIGNHLTEKEEKGKFKLNANQIVNLIKQCDELFSVGKFSESYSVLTDLKETKNAEVLWRLSRALYNMSKQKGIKKSESSKLILEAFELAEEALSLDQKNYAVHKWMAILVDAKSSLEGIKSRISTLPTFKKHLLQAMELNPNDATSIYMLGQYCYNIADMSWVQRKVASTLFAAPPEASFEEALEYFRKAEEAEPNFYSLNLLMLGKTYLKLNQIKRARYWLKCASTYPVRTDEDEEVRKEAEELLRKHVADNQDSKSESKPNDAP